MADIGCLMTDPMMRAVLSGDNAVTRRIGKTWARAKVGDRLWFREVWAYAGEVSVIPMPRERLIYRCDYPSCVHPSLENVPAKSDIRWNSSLLMPRSVCRATGIITSIGRTRLHDIDEADALLEGMGTLAWADVVAMKGEKRAVTAMGAFWLVYTVKAAGAVFAQLSCRDRFRLVFDLLSPGQWQLNPLVWRVEWRRE